MFFFSITDHFSSDILLDEGPAVRYPIILYSALHNVMHSKKQDEKSEWEREREPERERKREWSRGPFSKEYQRR
jgi:hypothetical protein